MMFLMIFSIFFILIMYVIPYLTKTLTKKINAEIIQIDDIEMEVYHMADGGTNITKLKNGVYNVDEFEVKLRGVEDSFKKAVFKNESIYEKCNYFKTITMQEIVYKKGDEIFAEIRFADITDYRKLSEYKNKHPEDYTKNAEGHSELKESYRLQADSYHKDNNTKINYFEVSKLIILVIIMFITCQNQ